MKTRLVDARGGNHGAVGLSRKGCRVIVGTLLFGHLLTGKVLGQRGGACCSNEGFLVSFIVHRDELIQVPALEAGD